MLWTCVAVPNPSAFCCNHRGAFGEKGTCHVKNCSQTEVSSSSASSSLSAASALALSRAIDAFDGKGKTAYGLDLEQIALIFVPQISFPIFLWFGYRYK